MSREPNLLFLNAVNLINCYFNFFYYKYSSGLPGVRMSKNKLHKSRCFLQNGARIVE